VIAKSFARIHRQNLANFGVLPLTFRDPADYDRIGQGDAVVLEGLRRAVAEGGRVEVRSGDGTFEAEHDLTARERQMVLAGGQINVVLERRGTAPERA
jgi:aconitate hydratase